MQIIVKGKNLEVSEALVKYVEGKLRKLIRHLDGSVQTTVEISRESARSQDDRYVVQITMLVDGAILRGEERAAEVRTAMDAVIDVIDRQIERYKGKRYLNRQRGGQTRIADVMTASDQPAFEEATTSFTGKVVKIKRFPVKPMYYEEAAEQMELLGHDFFFFLNAATNQYNVLYRRRDGDYGLIEPELA